MRQIAFEANNLTTSTRRNTHNAAPDLRPKIARPSWNRFGNLEKSHRSYRSFEFGVFRCVKLLSKLITSQRRLGATHITRRPTCANYLPSVKTVFFFSFDTWTIFWHKSGGLCLGCSLIIDGANFFDTWTICRHKSGGFCLDGFTADDTARHT